jgi:hypothetical protein
MSFGYAPSKMSSSGTDFGFVDMEYKGENNTVRFFYSENIKYGAGEYFDSSLSNPYLAMNQAYGVQSGFDVGAKMNITMGFAAGENGLYDGSRDYNDYDFDNMSYVFNNEISYDATKTLRLTAMNGILREDSAMLGLNGKGAFGIGDSDTYYMGMAVSWKLHQSFELMGSYYQGWTNPQNLSSSLMKTSALVSDSFALDGRYYANNHDTLGFQISSPLRVHKGRASFDVPVGRDNYSDEVYREKFLVSMKPDAREYKFSLYHMREVDERLSLRSEFDVRLNPDHIKDVETDYRAMFSLNWNF